MPRVTRAALRSQPSPADTENAAAVPLPATPTAIKRLPLGEISGNQEELPAAVEKPEQILKASKGPGKGKKGKGLKKSKEQHEASNNEKSANVLPDDNESTTSSAVEDACQDLRKEQPQGIGHIQIVMHDTSLPSPPSPAATAATEHLASTMTPTNPAMTAEPERANIDQNIEDMAQEVSLPLEQTLDQSEEFQQLPSQSNVQDQEASEQKCGDSPQKESKSPAEAVLRPEDSIEAIDKFEEEIEKVGDLIPDIKSSAQTPKGSKNDGNPAAAAKKETGTQNPTTTKLRRGPTPIDSKAAAFLKKRATVHPSALDRSPATKGDAKARQVSDSSTGSEKAPIAAKKRVSSVHKAPFVPAKSAKPPTRSNFELPGEAVARKLKEAREERLKHEEEERAKKPTFRARPVRLSQAPVVKATATSKARISMARGENLVPAATKTTSPKPKLTPRLSTLSAAGKRLSTLSVNKRSTPAPANISARFLRGPPSGAVRQSVSTTDAAQLKAKGKEVFNRGQIEHGEREKMKKEKEEAAKKARAEAAERGRLASREWAEKQKAKKVAEKKVKGETGEALVPVA